MLKTRDGISNAIYHNNFDLLRLIAAIQVMAYHAISNRSTTLNIPPHWIETFLAFFPGVPIFFTISGFLLTLSYDRNPEILSYWRNRILRIYPALFVCFAVTLIILCFMGFLNSIVLYNPRFYLWIVAQLSIVQFYNPDFLQYGNGIVNGSLWTISIELQFYLLLPFILTRINRFQKKNRSNHALFILFAASALIYYWIIPYPSYQRDLFQKSIYITAVPHLHLFIIGIFLARNFHKFQNVFYKNLTGLRPGL
jgi:peptidoglycan/LPS O-acetylase OafA/YrhL